MKKIETHFYFVPLVLSLAVLLAGLVQIGCETGGGTDGLTIEPSYVELSPGSNTAQFAVASNSLKTLSLPLAWIVSDGGLGSIIADSGNGAVYKRTSANGDNTVIAIDQYETEGFATVRQVPATTTTTTTSTTTTTTTSTTTTSSTTTTTGVTTTTTTTTTTTSTTITTVPPPDA